MGGDGDHLAFLVNVEDPLLAEAVVVGSYPPEDVAVDVQETVPGITTSQH